MAHQMEKRWEKSDGKLHVEEEITPTEAKQGRTGSRILLVLLAALILAFLVWIPVEIWGNREAEEVAPQQPGQEMQSQQAAPPASPSAQEGSAVPTQTPNAPAAPNVQPATPATPAPSQPAQ
jgi:cytoskeletal protein RodZ